MTSQKILIENYKFDYVCQIIHELNLQDNPEEFLPQSRYENKKIFL